MIGPTEALHDTLFYVVFHATRAITAFLQRDSYLYWPFLISTLLLALLVGRRGPGAVNEFFDRKLWWHPSARADYRLYFANALVFPLLASLLLFSDGQIVTWMNSLLGLEPQGHASVAARVAFTLSFFLAYDLGRFIGHTLMHDVAALWPFHKVHHSAEVLTPMTSYRLHPVELMIMAWIPALLTGATAWLFNLAGAQVSFYTFLGLHVAIWAFNLVDNLRHSPVWITYGQIGGRWLISPAHHQLHHSYETRHLGCNRGSNLAIWDRLYGTLYVPSGAPETFCMGLGDEDESRWHKVTSMYWRPFRSCIDLLHASDARGERATAGAQKARGDAVAPAGRESA